MGAVQLPLFPHEPRRPQITGDADLCGMLADVVEVGFPHVEASRLPAVGVRWNRRLRSTVGRAMLADPDLARVGAPTIELSSRYHEAYPDEVAETLAHEFAHVLHWGAGHGPSWREELAAALGRLGIEVRGSLRFARRLAPVQRARYTWVCGQCRDTIAHRDRRRADEVAMTSRCCGAALVVLDTRLGNTAVAARPFLVRCRACGIELRSYDDSETARRFARRHRCACDGRLEARRRVRSV